MAKSQQIQSTTTTSQLDRFALSFEYDKTFQQVKHEVRTRTYEQ